MIQWAFLLLAGGLEIGWAVTLKLTNGWTNFGYLAVNVLFGLGAAYSLSLAMRSSPMMVAYPVWKGLAILGLLVWETMIDRHPLNAARALYALLIVVGIVGLKLSTEPTPVAEAPRSEAVAP